MKVIKFFFVLAILTISCTKEIDLKIDPLLQKVVVNSLFCQDSVFAIHVSLSGGTDGSFMIVNDAVIELFENGNSIFVFNTGNGWYKTSKKPTIGKEYLVKVKVEGFTEVVGKSSIPKIPSVIEATYYIADGQSSNSSFYQSKTNLSFLDDELESNFYESGLNSFLFEPSKETNPSLIQDSELDFNPLYFFYSDNLFNGKKTNITFFGGGNIYSGFDGTIMADSTYPLNFKIVSPEYYNFRKSWTKHVFNQNSDAHYDDPLTLLFLGDPVVMYSNVDGGLGVFAGYNQQVIDVVYVE